jgi:hypothetical protein
LAVAIEHASNSSIKGDNCLVEGIKRVFLSVLCHDQRLFASWREPLENNLTLRSYQTPHDTR